MTTTQQQEGYWNKWCCFSSISGLRLVGIFCSKSLWFNIVKIRDRKGMNRTLEWVRFCVSPNENFGTFQAWKNEKTFNSNWNVQTPSDRFRACRAAFKVSDFNKREQTTTPPTDGNFNLRVRGQRSIDKRLFEMLLLSSFERHSDSQLKTQFVAHAMSLWTNSLGFFIGKICSSVKTTNSQFIVILAISFKENVNVSVGDRFYHDRSSKF